MSRKILLGLFACISLALVGKAELDLPETDGGTNILDWEAPEEIQKNFPYYLAGHHNGSAIWIWPLGSWPMDSMSSEQEDLVSKHFDQGMARLSNSSKNNDGALVLVDIADAGFFKTNYGFAFDKAKTLYKSVEDSDLKRGWIINSNLIFDVTWKILQLLVSKDLAEKIEVYDTDDERWRETITNWIPKENLPTKYGGFGNFTPEKNFG